MRAYRFRLPALSLIPALALLQAAPALAVPSPTQRVKEAVSEVITVLKDEDLDREQRWARIGVVINRSFDFQAMSQSVLATNWRQASSSEKRRFVEFFSQYLEETYRTRIEDYTDQEIRYEDERITGNRAVVDTIIVAGEKEIPVSYKLRLDEHENEWFAYDVVIENVSLVNNYRNTFDAIVRTEGMEGLLDDLQDRISRYKSKQAAGETAAGAEAPAPSAP